MKTILCITAILAALVLGVAAWTIAADSPAGAAKEPVGKVFELRTYTAAEGKLDALNARFRDHTCALFKKHGIEVVGFWTPATGEEAKNTLIYLCVFSSVDAQKKAWAESRTDPDWVKAKADSEKDGVLAPKVESKTLVATDYSPMK